MKTPIKAGFFVAPLAAVAVATGTLLWFPGAGGAHSSTLFPAGPLRSGDVYVAPAKVDPADTPIELEVKDVIPIEEADTHAVVLVSKDQQVMLPIFVTEEAAVSIAFRLAQRTSPHPLAADLMDDLVAKLGGKVTEVRIEDVQNDIYTSHVVVHQGNRDLAIEARPSDAIAMALTGKAKILTNQKVLDAAGITREEIDSLRKDLGVGGGGGAGIGDEDEDSPALPHPSEPGGKSIPTTPDDSNIRL
ncbi:MAG: bifunctional nuclease family protein [Myxococcaceae bacterium]|nr:bifunctional nuclease family protein [Myxococcaceae bacterium]